MTSKNVELTQYLKDWYQGDEIALEELLRHTYRDLKAAANFYLSGERRTHTLQPTALINEVYLRLRANTNMRFDNRAQFFGFSGRLMRQILLDYARGRSAAKRGGGKEDLALDDVAGLVGEHGIDLNAVIAVDAALKKLEAMDARQAQVVELRFFSGLSVPEVALAMEISESTVMREWRTARLWLARELSK